jgi:hypothetical protein
MLLGHSPKEIRVVRRPVFFRVAYQLSLQKNQVAGFLQGPTLEVQLQ